MIGLLQDANGSDFGQNHSGLEFIIAFIDMILGRYLFTAFGYDIYLIKKKKNLISLSEFHIRWRVHFFLYPA